MTSWKAYLRFLPALAMGAAVLSGGPSFAQVTPAAGYTPPDDTPSVKVGGVIFTDFTYTGEPQITDADKNVVGKSEFEVRRAYINVTGNISHLIAFRITPDISSRLSTTASGLPAGATVSTSQDGSLVIRLKYAYGQVNFDDFATHGSWARLGQQQTPYVDFMEGIYRYRFQGTIFVEREGFVSSSDLGISTRYNFPGNYGDVHAGFYNGDTYTKSEANDQKAFQIRGSLRPLPTGGIWKGLRLSGFYDADKPIKDGSRNRFIGSLTFEHDRLNLGFDYLDAKDRTSVTKPEIQANGWSVWATPRTKFGLEGFFRYDRLKPNKDVDATKNRTIAGVSYWFPVQKGVTAVLFGDFEQVKYDAALSKPDEKRYSLHAQFTF